MTNEPSIAARPVVLGLTGGMGVGKSTAARAFAARGAVVADGDAIGRAILEPGGSAVEMVVERFGDTVRGSDGGIDRAALASIVFGHADQLKRLTDISYPAINEALARIVESSVDVTDLVVLDLAVLVEGNLGEGLYDKVLVVEAPLELRFERLAKRGVDRADAEARMASQASDAERRAIADFVIVNDGTEADLDHHIELLHAKLTAKQARQG